MGWRVRLADAEERKAVFETLMRDHQHQIFRYCVLRLGPLYGEEVAQEVFLAAWQGLSAFRGDAVPTTWLLGIAKNKCAQMFRNTRRREDIARMFLEEITQSLHPDTHAASAEHERRQDQLTRLRQVLDRLRSEERILVILRYRKGLAIAEIAELIGKSEVAIRKQLLRILQRLRRILTDAAEG